MMKGIFLDGCVTGVDYRTQTMEGALDAQGMYEYREGESILFTIGDFVLGSAAAKAYMTPLDFVAESEGRHRTVQPLSGGSILPVFLIGLWADRQP